MSIDALIADLTPILGPEGVLTGEQLASRQSGVWASQEIKASVIFRPSSTKELSQTLKSCNLFGQQVVVHGGLTGLVSGALTRSDDVVISTERLNQIEKISVDDRTMRLQAGVRLESAQVAAKKRGLMLPLDLGARGSCTLGGNAATNAGGHQVIRYGMMRESILGLEVVLADGTIIDSMNSMLKNNAGYDLKHLFIGSEGTLGIISRLILRLRPESLSQETALLACTDFSHVIALLNRFDRSLGGTLTAFEVMWKNFYQLVANSTPPLADKFPFYILMEALGNDPEVDRERFIRVISQAEEAGELADAVIVKSGAERDRLWQLRDGVDKIVDLGPSKVFDVSLPLSEMDQYVIEVKQRLKSALPKSLCFVFGHVGDGNLHLVCVPNQEELKAFREVEKAVYNPLANLRGSISGEHGIGLEKKDWLSISRTNDEIQLMRLLKTSLDPQGILNSGRIFD
ncbi:MAG: FAD-binding oxidoreductase [Pseudomonadota bacterium]|nr:FAD-binding oxidoreductase [Pseudomonadota bacterium]